MSPRLPTRFRLIVAGLALVALLGACSDEQDPGLAPSGDEPATTSNTLGQCPAGGPDATTPAAGCLGADGTVQRPG